MRKVATLFVLSGVLLVAETKLPPAPAPATSRTAYVDEKSIVTVRTSVGESTLFVLPPGEKIMSVFSGNREDWEIQAQATADRFFAVMPKMANSRTNLQIVTDHKNTYSFNLVEVSGQTEPFDMKVFIEGSGAIKDNLLKPVEFVPASDVDRYKREADAAKAATAAAQAEAQQKITEDAAKFRAAYPGSLRFDYTWDRKIGDKFNVEQIYHDDKFFHIVAHPQETPVLYEKKDGKPSLISFTYADNLYTAPKIVKQGWLVVGKEKMPFNEVGR